MRTLRSTKRQDCRFGRCVSNARRARPMDGPSQSRSRESVGLFYLFVGVRGFDENPSFDKTAGQPFWTLPQATLIRYFFG